MAIPKAVREQGERSEKLLLEAGESGKPEIGEPEIVKPQEPAPVEVKTDWEQRYNVLQGKYNSEVPTLNRQVQDAQQLVSRLQEDIGTANTKIAELEKQQTESSLVNENTSAELDKTLGSLADQGYPDEFIEVMRSIASANQGAEVSSLKSKLAEVSGTVSTLQSRTAEKDQTEAQQAEVRFWEAFNEGAPEGWEKINDDPEFLAWLEEVDPASGASRKQLLTHARNNLDSGRTLYFFNAWNDLKNNAQADLKPEPMLTPQEGGGDAAPLATGRTWSRTEVSAFYDQVRSGKYRGREEDQQRIEQDIFAAQQDGRLK